jgi:hypothetical protein
MGLNYSIVSPKAGDPETVTIGTQVVPIKDYLAQKVADKLTASARDQGWPASADKERMAFGQPAFWKAVLIIAIMVLYVTMVYGPIAAYLVELFPAKIRYTSMSLPYHIGNGWFGGMLPLLATAIVAVSGNIYAGLWYPIGVALMTLIVGTFFLHDTKGRETQDDEA